MALLIHIFLLSCPGLFWATTFYHETCPTYRRRNLIVMLLATEIVMLACNLNFLFASAYLNDMTVSCQGSTDFLSSVSVLASFTSPAEPPSSVSLSMPTGTNCPCSVKQGAELWHQQAMQQQQWQPQPLGQKQIPESMLRQHPISVSNLNAPLCRMYGPNCSLKLQLAQTQAKSSSPSLAWPWQAASVKCMALQAFRCMDIIHELSRRENSAGKCISPSVHSHHHHP